VTLGRFDIKKAFLLTTDYCLLPTVYFSLSEAFALLGGGDEGFDHLGRAPVYVGARAATRRQKSMRKIQSGVETYETQ
jgi:hypothetical protein